MRERVEWPEGLRNAPPPDTVSATAREALLRSLLQEAEGDLQGQRELCADVQAELGAIQMNRYAVMMSDDIVAGVPVRRLTPVSPRKG
jgi:hypothetical protein